MNQQKIIAVFDLHGNFLSCCTREKAKKIIANGKGKYTAKRTIRLNCAKVSEEKDRHEVIREAKRKCYICGQTISKKDIATVDHMIPKSRDKGTEIIAKSKINMRCCCFRCNNDKGDMTLLEYIQHIKENRDKYFYLSDKRIMRLEEFARNYEKDYYGFYKDHVEELGGFLNE